MALQGAFQRHIEALRRLGVKASEVRTPDQLDRVDRLILPGGESTAIAMLLERNELRQPLADRLESAMPVFGTCAGMIMLAATVADARDDQWSFAAIDIAVRRNGYGRQLASFEADVEIEALGPPPFGAIFIRAPVVEAVGTDVTVLATIDGNPVLCRAGVTLVASFHPELADDVRLHEYFCSIDEAERDT